MDDFGTLAWCDRRNGRMTAMERWTMALQGAWAVLTARGGGGSVAPDVNADVPDTPFTRLADRLLEETSPPWLVHHGGRTWAWATALGADLSPDRELLYCASKLHDLGLVAPFEPELGACFAAAGARGARAQLVRAGMPTERARVVADAIALHLNVVVGLEHGPEAHLLRAATALDVVGQGYRRLPPEVRRRTLALHPRGDFTDALVRLMAQRAEGAPETRLGFLCARLGLLERAKAAPFEA